MSFLKKLKRSKQAAALVPRELKDIQAEFNQLTQRAGSAQYQQYVLDKDLQAINDRLVSVNNEAAARQKLDKESAAKTAAQPESSGQ